METLSIEYNVRSEFISKLLQSFSKIIGATIRNEYVPTSEEQAEINKSLNSGISTMDISELKKFLRS